jgi:hypothetical protein
MKQGPQSGSNPRSATTMERHALTGPSEPLTFCCFISMGYKEIRHPDRGTSPCNSCRTTTACQARLPHDPGSAVYTGSIVQLRRVVARLRPTRRETFLRLRTFPGGGEPAQGDWGALPKWPSAVPAGICPACYVPIAGSLRRASLFDFDADVILARTS